MAKERNINNDNFSVEELWKLYDIFIARENEIRSKWRSSMNNYTSLIISIVGGIIVLCNFLNNSFFIKLIFAFGAFLVLLIDIVAYKHFKLDYKYQMELLSVQSKLEDLLGLTNPQRSKELPPRWRGEAILPPWFYNDKNTTSGSKEFVKKMCSFKSINGYSFIYVIYGIIAIGLLIIAVIY